MVLGRDSTIVNTIPNGLSFDTTLIGSIATAFPSVVLTSFFQNWPGDAESTFTRTILINEFDWITLINCYYAHNSSNLDLLGQIKLNFGGAIITIFFLTILHPDPLVPSTTDAIITEITISICVSGRVGVAKSSHGTGRMGIASSATDEHLAAQKSTTSVRPRETSSLRSAFTYLPTLVWII